MSDGKTVRVRILVVVDSDGKWAAQGDGQNADDQVREWVDEASGDLGPSPWGRHWVTADVPLPIPPETEIEGEVLP